MGEREEASMGGEENGLTLQGLAQMLEDQTQRLETLERENKRMFLENAQLRSEVAALRGSSDKHRVVGGQEEGPEVETSAPEERVVSRRRLLRKAGTAAVGIVAAGALTQLDIREAKAAIVSGTTNTASRGAVEGTNESDAGYGMWGNSNYAGVVGWGDIIGVSGSGSSVGVYASSSGDFSYGVAGQSTGRGSIGVSGVGPIGVQGTGSGTTNPGVLGKNPDAVGVTGTGKIGVTGQSSTAGFVAVYGQHIGTGGIGVRGDGAKDGYGGQFRGGKAQLRLTPQATNGRPTTGTHTTGEIYLDARGTLFVCTASGTPGTWRRVDTTAA